MANYVTDAQNGLDMEPASALPRGIDMDGLDSPWLGGPYTDELPVLDDTIFGMFMQE